MVIKNRTCKHLAEERRKGVENLTDTHTILIFQGVYYALYLLSRSTQRFILSLYSRCRGPLLISSATDVLCG